MPSVSVIGWSLKNRNFIWAYFDASKGLREALDRIDKVNEWIAWAKQIRAICQIGKTYAENAYDLQRYDQITEIVHAMLAKLADAPMAKVENFFVPDAGYATPKVDLRAGVFRDQKILLVRERSDDCWALPGGWADVAESPTQGIEKEVFEESGYVAKVIRLVAIKDRSLHNYRHQYPDHLYKLFFLCQLVGGSPLPNIEISEIDFFPLTALPPLSESRVLKQDIELLWAYHNDPHKQVYCD